MKRFLAVVLVALFWLGITVPGLAAVTPTNVQVSLGNTSDELKFFPNQFEFQTGQKYKLTLTNPSHTKHYFTAKDFADNSWTQKVEAGQVEVKGAIHELELRPGATAEWFFVPMKAGTYQLHCSVPGHQAAGMVGEIVLKES